MKASKISHKGNDRIKLEFVYSNELVAQIKQIADARWSKTKGTWHIPYTKESWQQLKTLVPDVEYEKLNDKTVHSVGINGNVETRHALSLPQSITYEQKKQQQRDAKKELMGVETQHFASIREQKQQLNEFRLWMQHKR